MCGEGVHGEEGMHGKGGNAWEEGTCMVRVDMCGEGGHAW